MSAVKDEREKAVLAMPLWAQIRWKEEKIAYVEDRMKRMDALGVTALREDGMIFSRPVDAALLRTLEEDVKDLKLRQKAATALQRAARGQQKAA